MVMLNTFAPPQADTKQQQYNVLLQQIRDIVYNEEDLVANLSNIAAILHQQHSARCNLPTKWVTAI